MTAIFAAAGFAEMSPGDEKWFWFGIFLGWMRFLFVYCICVFGPWVYLNRRSFRRPKPKLKPAFFVTLGVLLVPAVVLAIPCAIFFFLYLNTLILFG
jgi:hypothetical protein